MATDEKQPASFPAAGVPTPDVRRTARTYREITSAELFGSGREIQIRHADEIYILRQTNKGKLILTK